MQANIDLNNLEAALNEFKGNNPHAMVTVDSDNSICIDKPWGLADCRIKFGAHDHDFIDDLNRLLINPMFDAVLHIDTNEMEVFFGYLKQADDTDESYINRQFSLVFEGKEYSCRYSEPTARTMQLAKCYEQIPGDPSDRSAGQLQVFKDAQELDRLPPRHRNYFQGREPRNFFIKAELGFESVNVEKLAKHLNFLMHYYDRRSPIINIRESAVESRFNEKERIRLIEDHFPSALVSASAIDEFIIQLLNVARRNNPRSSFIYYYQVFEYAGYYYIDGKARAELRSALRDPALICCGEDKISDLFGIFSDLAQNDDGKMKKVIEEHCDPKVIWREITNDHDFFTQSHCFDGGFVTQPLIAKDTTEESWRAMWMPKTYDLLTKIRNVLVHAREKRENKVILPTRRNNLILRRYIPVIERIAEQLALKD